MIAPRIPILPPELQQQLQAEIRPGEKQIWAGQPLPRLLRRQSLGVMIFGIPFTAFAIFWMAAAGWGVWGHAGNSAGPFIAFPLFGIPFILIGLGMVTSPLWIGKTAKRTIYALTDQRAIVFKGKIFGGVNVQSFEPDRLTSIQRNQRSDGTGDLIFEQFTQRQGTGTTTVKRGFIGIENVQQVEGIIHDTLLKGKTRNPA